MPIPKPTSKPRKPKVAVPCAACGTTVPVHASHLHRASHRFCSPECQQTPVVPKTCDQCGGAFLAIAKGAGRARWCSRECHNTYLRDSKAHIKGANTDMICEHCGASYRVRSSVARTQRFCSKQCVCEHRKKMHLSTPPKNIKVEQHCKYCGVSFWIYPSRIKDGRGAYCCRPHAHAGNLLRFANGERTDIEIAMAVAMRERGVIYQEQVMMFDKFLVDFLIPLSMLIVQCDGLYWHDRPAAKARDKGQDAYFKQCGYRVLRFTDKQIYSDVDKCINAVLAAI